MMALEEFQECEQREEFLRRERDDLVAAIENTRLTITELDQCRGKNSKKRSTSSMRISRLRFNLCLAADTARCGSANRTLGRSRD